MSRYFLRSLLSHLRQNRSLYVLTVLGVALGVASVVCIQLLSRGAVGAFRGSVQAIAGRSDLTVVGPTPSLDEQALVTVLGCEGVEAAWPLARAHATCSGRPGETLEIVGLDVLSLASLPWVEGEFDAAGALGQPGWIALTPELAGELGLAPGDRFEVSAGSRRVPLVVGARVDFRRQNVSASRRLAVMDLAQLQALFGLRGRLAEIGVRVARGERMESVALALEERLGPGFSVLGIEARVAQTEELLQAFRLNLSALSLVSLFVGFFLVYTSLQASLVRRRVEFGVLRSLGASRGQVLGLILAEVTLLGLVGMVLGLALGWAGARGSLGDVSQTLTNVYLLDAIETLEMDPWVFVVAALTGVGGAVAGALVPALDLTRRHPRLLLSRVHLDERTTTLSPWFLGAALGLFALTALWYASIGRGWRPGGFVLGVAVLLGVPLLAPVFLVQVYGRVALRGMGIRYGLRGLVTRLRSSSFAVAALAISISILVGLTLLVASFRSTLELWVNSVIQADVYVTTPSYTRGVEQAVLDPALVEAMRRRPEVAQVDVLRRTRVALAGRPVNVIGVVMNLPGGQNRFPLLEGEAAAGFDLAARAGQVLISEPLSYRLGLREGDELTLPVRGGERRVRIAGVYYDYGSESGAVAMDLTTFAAAYGAGEPNSVSLYLTAGSDPDELVASLRQELAEAPLILRSNATLRGEVFRIFDQTFVVTRVLQGVCLLVAAIGAMLTLLVLAREQVAELALVRALGAPRGKIFVTFVGKGLGLGGGGLVLGMLGGVLLAVILIHPINYQYFGWTIRTDWSALWMGEEYASLLVVVILSSLYPAWKASRVAATELSREDG